MTTPLPKHLASAIANASAKKVQDYIAKGGSLLVVLESGKSPLAELVHHLSKDTNPDHDPWSTPLVAHTADELTEAQKAWMEMGCILIRGGCVYTEKTAKTNRSVSIDKYMSARHPVIHREWAALHQRNLIMGGVQGQLDTRPDVDRKARKM